jgi:hypothetical protein
VAGCQGKGVYRRHEGKWEPIPGSATLGGTWIVRIVPSPKGGEWIVGEGIVARVEERLDLPEGFAVLERVGVWQGLPTAMIMDLIEDDDGTLWLATDMSLVKIPPAARFSKPSPPNVVPVEVSVDGRTLDPDRDIELPYRRNRLELRFAALSYREPALVRYRARIRPDEAWSRATSQPSFRFVDLAAGSYQVEVQASLDGGPVVGVEALGSRARLASVVEDGWVLPRMRASPRGRVDRRLPHPHRAAPAVGAAAHPDCDGPPRRDRLGAREHSHPGGARGAADDAGEHTRPDLRAHRGGSR